MVDRKKTDEDNQNREQEKQFIEHLKGIFSKLPNKIKIILFANKQNNDVFVRSSRELIRLFTEINPKISFEELELDHELAKKWNINHSPTLLIDPDKYNIKWHGGPLGEEGKTFLEMLLLIAEGKSNLSLQSKKVLEKINYQRDIKVFVSPTCPYCPQQALNALQAVMERPDFVSLDIVDIQACPQIAEKYGVRSVPQTFANDLSIGLGAQQQELFCSSLEKMTPQNIFIPDVEDEIIKRDLVIVGGGPAGLTAGIYAVRSGLSTVIIEKDSLGGQMATTPIVENYTGFTQVGGKTLVDMMVSHALQYANIFQGEEVVDITLGDTIIVKTSRRKILTRAVLLATGATHRFLDVEGEKRLAGRGVSYCSTCDGPIFVGKKVIIVGGGNSAVTEALHLHNIGVDVTLVHRKDSLRAQDSLLKAFSGKQIHTILNTEVKEILGTDSVESAVLYNNKTGKYSTIRVEGIFVSIGYTPTTGLAEKIGVELTEGGYIEHIRHRTNIQGIYSAGDIEGGYRQIVIAAGQGSEASLTIFEDLINPYWKN